MVLQVLTVVLLSTLVPTSYASAQERERPGAVVGPLRLVPRGETLLIEGLHNYFGAIEVGSASDGLVVTNRLSLERYLLGLNEVPVRWPVEALKAQAIAARTYALWTLSRPRAGAAAVYGFDICATVQCQVFSGADVVRGVLQGERWADAVGSTARRAILFRGEPILARYHSTSGGSTLANETVFPSDGAFPYLQPVESTTEEASPLYRWQVRFRLRRLTRMVTRGGLHTGGRLREVTTVPSASGRHYPDVLLRGRRGVTRITAEELRTSLRVLAPQMYPNRYPSAAPTGSGRLPETFPSNRYEIETVGRVALVTGRGWGHGVGMSQWGAEGLARRGRSAEEILTHYYTGTTTARVQDPGPIEVGIAWGQEKVTVVGDMKIVDGRGRMVVAHALGTWVFKPAGAGAVAVRPPRGFGLPLRVGIVSAPKSVSPGGAVPVTIALSRPARVKVADQGRSAVVAAGRRDVVWRAPSAPGTYRVRVVADDGRRRRRASIVVAVEQPAPPDPVEPNRPPPGDEDPPPIGLVVAALVLLGSVAFAARKVTIGR